jgi:hypothetical protein
MAAIVAGGCSKDPTPGGAPTTVTGPTLPFTAPSATELGDAAGIAFPTSKTGYRSVQLDADQIDVTFQMPAAEVDEFVDASALGPLEEGLRTIVHSSPVWQLDPAERVRGAETTRNGLRRSLEVGGGATADEPVTIRLSIRPA